MGLRPWHSAFLRRVLPAKAARETSSDWEELQDKDFTSQSYGINNIYAYEECKRSLEGNGGGSCRYLS